MLVLHMKYEVKLGTISKYALVMFKNKQVS